MTPAEKVLKLAEKYGKLSEQIHAHAFKGNCATDVVARSSLLRTEVALLTAARKLYLATHTPAKKV